MGKAAGGETYSGDQEFSSGHVGFEKRCCERGEGIARTELSSGQEEMGPRAQTGYGEKVEDITAGAGR